MVALVLFVLFATLVAGALWPLQLLNPLWQLRLAGSLVNGAPFALLGLALLQIAVELGPHDPLLKSRQKLCSQLAVAVALGFLLLLPLQGVAGLQQSRSTTRAQSSRINGAERRLVALRQAVASAASNEEINQRLQRLHGPVLGPADIAQPLPLLSRPKWLPCSIRRPCRLLVSARPPLRPIPGACYPSYCATASPAWRWPWALPPWRCGPAPRFRCCRSGRGAGAGGSGACGKDGQPAAPVRPRMRSTSANSVGRSRSDGEDCLRHRCDEDEEP